MVFEKFTVEDLALKEIVLKLGKEEPADLLLFSLKKHKDWKGTLLKKATSLLEEKGDQNLKALYDKQFYDLFDRIGEIIDEHNELGGGPEEEEEEVHDALEEITTLFKEKKLSNEIKDEFLDSMIHCYSENNHGMVDMVLDAAYDVAETKEDWEFILHELKRNQSGHNQNLIMGIYKDKLHDEEAYLRMRLADLRYGTDYFDLATFYQEKNNLQKAIEIAEIGIKKGEGNITNLLEFLFDYYKKQNNYIEAMNYAKKIFTKEPSLERYRWLKEFAKTEDWKTLEPWSCTNLNQDDLVQIQWEHKEYDKVLSYVLKKPDNYGIWYNSSLKDKFAEKLSSIYPAEMKGYYKEKVEKLLNLTVRENYANAAKYAIYLKDILLNQLNLEKEWEEFINAIRSAKPTRPALLNEFRKL